MNLMTGLKKINIMTNLFPPTGLNVLLRPERDNPNTQNIIYKSILDADLIKRYNGGRYLYSLKVSANNKTEWELKRLNDFSPPFNYVLRVCNINE